MGAQEEVLSDPLELGEVQRLALLPVLRLVVLQEPLRAVWQYFVLAWLLSPYGVPLFAALLVEGLDAVCGRLRAI